MNVNGGLTPGMRVGSYEILDLLGDGSFGITYSAMDLELNRKVAIKEFFPVHYAQRTSSGTIIAKNDRDSDLFEWALARFGEEAQTLARFSHPNIVRVITRIRDHGTYYIVMEYVPGTTLERFVHIHGLPSPELTLRIMDRLLDGCEAIHRIGILHRDIKPSNVMIVTDDNGDPVPILIDFGSSRDLALQETGFSAVVTPGYSPPEQYSRNNLQKPASDIYALAGTAYFLLTGIDPPQPAVRQIESLAPVPPERAAQFSQEFLGSVMEGFALNIDSRPQSIAQWRPMLQLRQAVNPASQPKLAIPAPKQLSRRSILIGGGALGLAVVGGGGALVMVGEKSLKSSAAPLNIGWTKQLGVLGVDPFVQIATTGEGAMLAAHSLENSQTKMLALKLDDNGTVVSRWEDDVTNGEANSILPISGDGAFVGGRVDGQAVLVKLGKDWTPSWRVARGEGRVNATLVTDEGVIIGIEGVNQSRARLESLDGNGSLLWGQDIDKGENETVQRMIRLANGGYAVLGMGVQQRQTPSGDHNENYAWVALLDNQGKVVNRPQSNGLGAATGWAITQVGDYIYVAGRTSNGQPYSPSRLFLWCIDSSGANQWQRWDYPVAPSSARALAGVGDDALYVGGWAGNPLQARVSQIGKDGEMVWDHIGQLEEQGQRALIAMSLRETGDGFAVLTSPLDDNSNRLILARLLI